MADWPDIATLIDELGLAPLPVEGGFFAVSYRSDEVLSAATLPDRYHGERAMGGAIYFLTTAVEFSALHRLNSDEVYFFHGGDALQMLFLGDDGYSEVRLLGTDVAAGQRPQTIARRGHWHGSRPLPGGPNGYSLIGTSMAPAYADSDVEFANRENLIDQFPEQQTLITALTRLDSK